MNFKRLVIGTTFLIAACSGIIVSIQTANHVHAVQNTITIRSRGAKVYNKNGNAIVDARGKNIVLKEGTVAEYYGEPKYMVWRGHKKASFYNIGGNRYLLGYNVASLNDKGTLSIYRDSYIYDKTGKRVEKNTVLRKGTAINYVDKLNEKIETEKNLPKFYYYNMAIQRTHEGMLWVKYSVLSVKYHIINGKEYYKIANNKYIRATNIVYINGRQLFTTEATVTMGKATTKDGKYYARNMNGKITKTILPYRPGQKVVVDRSFQHSSKSFWRIKGTNYYIFGPDIKKFPIQALRR